MYRLKNVTSIGLDDMNWRSLLILVCAAMFALSSASQAQAQHYDPPNIRDIRGVSNDDVLKGEVDITARCSGDCSEIFFKLTGPVELEVVRSGRAPSFMLNDAGEKVAWDTTTVPDGEYELTVYAKVDGEVFRSRTRSFTVDNVPDVVHASDDTPAQEPADTEQPPPSDTEEVKTNEEVDGQYDPTPESDQPFSASFAHIDNTYQQGSGDSIKLDVTGTPTENTDVLVIAWSNAERRLVGDFAFALTGEPWQIPASRLDLLPAGGTSLQLLIREDGQTQEKVKQQIEVLAPLPEPVILIPEIFVVSSTVFVAGDASTVDISLSIPLADGLTLTAQAFSVTENKLVAGFEHELDPSAPAIKADKLNALAPGDYKVSVKISDGEKEKNTASFDVKVEAPVVPEPTPEPNPEPTPSADPVASFNSTPSTYTVGSGVDLSYDIENLPAGGDVLVIAWSDKLGALVDDFAHYLTEGPYRISASKMDVLPAGTVELQLIVRGGDTRPKTVHRLEIIRPTTTNPTPGDEPTAGGDPTDPTDPTTGPDAGGDPPTDPPTDPAPEPTPEPSPEPTPDPVDEEPIEVDPPTEPEPTPEPLPDMTGSTIGFTVLSKKSDTQVIYVSDSEGRDSNDGLSENRPVKTLARGVELLRDNKPDWLLLKSGDVWENQYFLLHNKAGDSPDRPMVISSYGEGARPMIIPPHDTHGFKTDNDTIDGLVIKGLHFYAATRDPGSSKFIGRPGDISGLHIRIGGGEGKRIEGLVIEDNVITHFDDNVLLVDDWARTQGYSKPGRLQCVVRRNIIRFASSTDSHAIGIYIEGSRDSIIEQNLLDHNGWAQTDTYEWRNKRSHNIYGQSYNGQIIVRHNILTRGASHGLQLRAGGDVLNNLFVRNAMAFFASGSDSKMNYNVVLESDDINPEVGDKLRGMGIQCWSMNRGEVIGNVVARRVGSLQRPGLEVSADNLTVKDNRLYKWFDHNDGYSIEASSGANMQNNLTKEGWGGSEPPYVDPERGVEEYAASIGLSPTLDAFLDAAARRPAGQWYDEFDPATVCRFIRNGFDLLPHD